jgi:hypothetical protein
MNVVTRKRVLQTVIGGVILAAVTVGGSVGLGYLVGHLSASAEVGLDKAMMWGMGIFAVIVMAGAILVGTLWMRSIDEAAREAHKAAWYWGGSGGMAAGGVLMILSFLPQAARISIPSVLSDRTDPAAYAVTGALALMTLMMIGYLIVWAWWWIVRSRG